MKKILILVCAFVFVATVAFAAGPNKYQVTGPILELTADKIVVNSIKDKTKWEISRDAATKGPSDLKVGSKVTIEYKMTATKIEVKDVSKADTKKNKK